MEQATQQVIAELYLYKNDEKAAFLPRFFKTGKGEYGEGDLFIGIVVPDIRKVAKAHRQASLNSLHELLQSPIHEYRMVALFILTDHFEREKEEKKQEEYVRFYIDHVDAINNWDLVDLSCYKLLGRWLEKREKTLLYDWAKTDHLWKQRIAMVSCMHFVRNHQFDDTLAIADILLHHPHDLIHKAVGWILREAGKKDREVLTAYLLPRYREMPRTMLRYAIEHFPEPERKRFLLGTMHLQQPNNEK